MKIFTANIKNNPDLPDAQVRSDIKSLWLWQKLWSVGGFQEIGEWADHAAINSQFTKTRGFRQLLVGHQTPITVRTLVWSVVDSYWVKTHDGRAGVTPVRGFSVALLKQRVSGKKIAVINTHFVSGAWYGQNSYQAWRRARWNEHFAKMSAKIVELNNVGWTVVVMGDWNRHHGDIPALTSATSLVATNGYYDHIYVCPSGTGTKTTVKAKGVYTRHLYTDHDPVYVNLALS